MITIEISDESILFIIQFIAFSIIVGWFIVQWDLKRMRKRIEELKEREE